MAFDINLLNKTEFINVIRPTRSSQVQPWENPYVDRSGSIQTQNLLRSKQPYHHGLGKGFEGAEKLAKQLRESGAKYPLLVLTNMPEKLAGVIDPSHPNLIPLDMTRYFGQGPHGRTCTSIRHYEPSLQKLQMWNIQGYDRLMWLDTDVTVERSPDSVFEMTPKGGVMAMRCDQWCDFTPDFQQPENAKYRIHKDLGMNASELHEYLYRNTTAHDLASWAMLLEPNKEDFDNMVALTKELKFCNTDQDVLAEYFWRKSQTKQHELVQWFPPEVALWGRCVNPFHKTKKTPVPVLIHKKRASGFELR